MGGKVNHLLHSLVGLFTFGLWWLVWLLIAILDKPQRWIVAVNDQGQLFTRRA